MENTGQSRILSFASEARYTVADAGTTSVIVAQSNYKWEYNLSCFLLLTKDTLNAAKFLWQIKYRMPEGLEEIMKLKGVLYHNEEAI